MGSSYSVNPKKFSLIQKLLKLKKVRRVVHDALCFTKEGVEKKVLRCDTNKPHFGEENPFLSHNKEKHAQDFPMQSFQLPGGKENRLVSQVACGNENPDGGGGGCVPDTHRPLVGTLMDVYEGQCREQEGPMQESPGKSMKRQAFFVGKPPESLYSSIISSSEHPQSILSKTSSLNKLLGKEEGFFARHRRFSAPMAIEFDDDDDEVEEVQRQLFRRAVSFVSTSEESRDKLSTEFDPNASMESNDENRICTVVVPLPFSHGCRSNSHKKLAESPPRGSVVQFVCSPDVMLVPDERATPKNSSLPV
ncbi:hypothetical protein TcYC6_0077620 [Trypanosoma cruzi]|uniref:Uncharacterized protein n=2 Tax=Trypanosoma cruzi TaxID=5693 RepID=Q4D497_TRYCC|nr:hypothetical protein Tc00.1047053508809.50 [Trypanosoma cruzi]EAN87351.1 hypothetical protein Tc00.1047053508809.50 [Trypanosoma cruzi]KAF5220048.1 hypothetical protein ECC02_006956 [Trypanosoma cruzi]KAF8297907.1 hypothetical protein TcYC6_0077620 [Trypanosoma cruzi]RNC55565.1 hypothetical protein TcCL_ESM06945 [Trypanosoma cruzi]|eukprot:XP_809202.1 hypothetical protein [Trypanosoma cruzi strain CL Brener]